MVLSTELLQMWDLWSHRGPMRAQEQTLLWLRQRGARKEGLPRAGLQRRNEADSERRRSRWEEGDRDGCTTCSSTAEGGFNNGDVSVDGLTRDDGDTEEETET